MLKASNRDIIFKMLCYVVAVIVLVVKVINSINVDFYYVGLIFLLIFNNIVEKCIK